MPELPEVETIARSLRNPAGLPFDNSGSLQTRPGIVGRVVSSVELLWSRSLVTPTIEELGSALTGKPVTTVGRRGKFLVIAFEDYWMFIHLRMSGDLQVCPASTTFGKHDRLRIHLTDGFILLFSDPRKFGRVWLVRDPGEVLSGLGPEPLSDDFTPGWLHQELVHRRRQLKPLLLDQHFIAGLGNIYTDEALHRAKLHPLTISSSINAAQADLLWQAIRSTLQEGIRRNGASIDWVYRGGDFQNHFSVYGRQGETCPACGAEIQRILVGQRGTHFCPTCQKIRYNKPR